jgi:hypothetical protein
LLPSVQILWFAYVAARRTPTRVKGVLSDDQ